MTYRVVGSRGRFDLCAMKRPKIIVLAASSDIGAHLTEYFIRGGADVVGTYRNLSPSVEKLEKSGARLFPLDITSGEQVKSFATKLDECAFSWNILISAPAVLEPIGGFFSLDFDAWEESFITNSTAQLRVLHAAYGLRDRSAPAKVVFFAGGGTNGPFDNYSAYCAGKLVLIKMTELLDSEYPDLQVSIIGTGWVNTKIHRQTLAAGTAAGRNFDRTREFLDSEGAGATLETVAECVDWCLSSPRSAVGGRNFSLVHDPWRQAKTIDELNADPNLYKLRRLS
jgi:NAD(P)-dependent dehydrogenase (short-subunit alcohol dehydrogenase family)